MTNSPVPKVSLAHLPTPLEPAPRLAAALGLRMLWIKRDDCTGMALGGNKVRQLEFLLGDALAKGADVIVAHGHPQSNFARLAAAAACKIGIKCVLIIHGEEPFIHRGNLMLDELFEAEIRFVTETNWTSHTQTSLNVIREFKARGHKPYLLPLGGASAVGSLAYVAAIAELAAQADILGLRIDNVIVPSGSGGTVAGMMVGAERFLPDARFYGISIGPTAEEITSHCIRIAADVAKICGVRCDRMGTRFEVLEGWAGEAYGVPTEQAWRAMQLAAATEGLLLDPVYSGKALAALVTLTENRDIATESGVVFWHTGGIPTLFASDPPHFIVDSKSRGRLVSRPSTID